MKLSENQNNKNTRLFIITPTLDGGVGRIVANIAKGLSDDFKITLLVPMLSGDFFGSVPENVEIHSFGKRRISSCTMPLIKLFKKSKPDMILSLSFHTNIVSIISRIGAGLSKSRCIISEHINLRQSLKSIPILKRVIMKTLIFIFYRFAGSYIAVSKGAKESMSKISGVHISKINVIYNPVIDESFYRASEEKVEHPFFTNKEGPVIVTVGRLDYQKDIETLLKSFSYLPREYKARLIICGDGPLKSELKSRAQTLGVLQNIDFLGFVKNPLPYVKNSNLFVLSSIYEGLPTVLIEALALGVPIVSTDCPDGPKEILDNGRYGLLVPVSDPYDLRESIESALKENKIPKADKEYIERFTVSYAVAQYKNLIDSIIKSA